MVIRGAPVLRYFIAQYNILNVRMAENIAETRGIFTKGGGSYKYCHC